MVEIIRVERLEDEEKRGEYTREKWGEWSKLKGALVEVARRVCGVKK